MEAALGALCRAGGWSYAAVWRFHPQDPRLLTLGDCYCEDEAKAMVQKMLNLVEVVGEGILGQALVSGECQWIYDDTCHALNQISHADNGDLHQGYTWWQHQFLSGMKTIAVLPLQLHGLVQFGSTRKVPRSSVFLNQVRDIFDRMKNASSDGPMEYTQNNSLACGDSSQFKDTADFTGQGNSTFPELPNRSPEEATAETLENNMKDCSGNNSLLETMMLDLSTNSFVQDWWDNSVLLAENLPNSSEKDPEPAMELANRHSLPTGERGSPFIPVIEQLLGDVAHPPTPTGHSSLEAEATALAGRVSDYQLPQFAFRDCLTVDNAQIPALACSNYTCRTRSAQNGSSEVPSANVSVDDTCSLNTANSNGSQSSNPEGTKVAKRRARAGESTRPRPKDRQLIQDRVKELREIVPNGAKCSIDALLERTIKHMLFLQSVNKYAEKIKQADEPKIIDKGSGVILKDNPVAGTNGGATWAYEVAGQTMVCPIIIEDLSPPGQMLVEMLCEEQGLFLEIADNIRGIGLTVLKGRMELCDGKIWSRFLVEANREVTRMDIFLSLVQLLEQNSLVRSTDQMAKVMNNGVPSFANHQRSPLLVPVGIPERLQ
uniref:BHLH domain-containing protein n=2 Tax=Zea mays TaxID=4577 RepID=A0A804RKC6_MAIZE